MKQLSFFPSAHEESFEFSSCYKRASNENELLKKRYSGVMEINYDLDRQMVSFQANKQEPIFRWVKYREGFSKNLILYIIDHLNLHSHAVILDPFAGSGSSAFAAHELGMKAIAVELLPVGCFIMECRNHFEACGYDDVLKWAEKTLESMGTWANELATYKFNHITITNGAFPEETEEKLGRFMSWARKQTNEYRKFLEFVAFSILEDISYTRKDGQYLRWDYRAPKYATKEKKTTFDKGTIYTFESALISKLCQIKNDLQNRDNAQKQTIIPVKIVNGSIFHSSNQIQNNYIDCVITSPPYCNRYDYTRTYALELAFLGIDDEKVKSLRQSLLTCTVENKKKDFSFLGKDLNKKVDSIFYNCSAVTAIIDFLQDEKDNKRLNNNGIHSMVWGYLYDCAVHIVQLYDKIKSNGYYVMVNDNVQYNGLEVPIDTILSSFAEQVGFAVERIWILPQGKGNSSQQMKKYGRNEIRKCVYIWKKL